jgi:hypothetical protein
MILALQRPVPKRCEFVCRTKLQLWFLAHLLESRRPRLNPVKPGSPLFQKRGLESLQLAPVNQHSRVGPFLVQKRTFVLSPCPRLALIRRSRLCESPSTPE